MKKTLTILFSAILIPAVIAGAIFLYLYLDSNKKKIENQSEYSILIEENISIDSDDSYTLLPYLIKKDGTIATSRFQYDTTSDCITINQDGKITVKKIPTENDIVQVTIHDKNSGETATVNVTIVNKLAEIRDMTFIDATGKKQLVPEIVSISWMDSFKLEIYTQPQNINLVNYATVSISDENGNIVNGALRHEITSNCINFHAVGIGKGYINIVINNDSHAVIWNKRIPFSITTKEVPLGKALLAQQNSTLLTEEALHNDVETFILSENVADLSELYSLTSLNTIYLNLKHCLAPNEIRSNLCYRVPSHLFYNYVNDSTWANHISSIIPFDDVNDIFVVYHNEKGTTIKEKLFYEKVNANFELSVCQYKGYVNTGWRDAQKDVSKDILANISKNGIHIYSKWRQAQYAISFISEGKYGMHPIASVLLQYEEDYTLPTAIGYGYNFEYWSLDDNKFDIGQIVNKLSAADGATITLVAHWSPIKYTIEFSSDEKYGMTPILSTILEYEKDYALPSATGYGYNFTHWSLDGTNYTAGQSISKLSANDGNTVTLVANWSPIEYTIEFTTDERYGMVSIAPITLKYDEYSTLPSAEGYGYNFKYWSLGDNKFDIGRPINNLSAIDGDTVTLVANWSPIEYTIVFTADEKYGMTSITPITLQYDEYSALPTAEGYGYNFEYWSLGDNKFDIGQSINNLSATDGDTITLVANWSPIEYTIEFIADEKYGMTSIIPPVTLKYDQTYVLPIATGYGYNFAYWSLDNTNYTAGQSISKLSASDGNTVTLIANWSPIKYTLSFTHDDYYLAEETPNIVAEYDTTYKFPSATANGYNFVNWSITVDDQIIYANSGDAIFNLSAEDGAIITFISNWTPIEYTIEFVSDEKFGMEPIAPVKLKYNEDSTLPTAEGYGYSFDYWYIDTNGNKSFDAGENKYDAFTKVNRLSSIDNSTVNLIAHWIENEYTISFDPLGGNTPEGFQNNVTLKFSEPYVLQRLQKDGYTYYWFIDTNGNNSFDNDELKFNMEESVSKLIPNGNVIIKAQWVPITYTIEFYSDDLYKMTPVDSVTVKYDEEYILRTPNAQGYTFVEWILNNTSYSAGDSVKNLTMVQDATIKIKAIWAENTYTINFNIDDDITKPDDFVNSVTLNYSEEYSLPQLFKPGESYYWFADINGNGKKDDGEPTYNPTETISRVIEIGTITLIPIWGKNSYIIKFIADDKYNMSPINQKRLSYDESYQLPSATGLGYAFDYWTCNGNTYKGGDTISKLTTTDNEMLVFTSHWTVNSYTVKFMAEDTKYNMTPVSPIVLKYDESYVLPSATGVGYTFDSWTYNGTTYKAGTSISKLTASNNESLIFTSNWTVNKYTIKFVAGDSKYGMTSIKSKSLDYDTNYTLPAATGVGYTFNYWTYNGKTYKAGTAVNKLTAENGGTVTLTANWTINKYTVSFSATNATITLKKSDGSTITDGSSVEYGTTLTVSVAYTQNSNQSMKVYKTGDEDTVVTNTNDSKFSMPAYDVTIYASSADDGCVATGTLITLADGSQVPVEDLTGDEVLLVWNLMTGTFDSAPILFIDSEPSMEFEIINLHFSDGTSVKVIDEHAFYDCDLNKYVFMRNGEVSNYIGHRFNKQTTDEYGNMLWTTVELIDVVITQEYTRAWSPVTYGHLCFYVNGMLSMPGATTGLINIFEVDSSTMKIDYSKYLDDVEEFGLFTYDEFGELFNLPEEIFNAVNGQFLKISLGKGLITYAEIDSLINKYSKFF